MEDHETHPLEDAPLHPRYDLVVDLTVRRVSPPGEHVSASQNLVGEPVFGHFQVAVRTSRLPSRRKLRAMHSWMPSG